MARVRQAVLPAALAVGLLVVAVLLAEHGSPALWDMRCEGCGMEALPLLLFPAAAWAAAGTVPVVAVGAVVSVAASIGVSPRRPVLARWLRWLPVAAATLVVVAVAVPLLVMVGLT